MNAARNKGTVQSGENMWRPRCQYHSSFNGQPLKAVRRMGQTPQQYCTGPRSQICTLQPICLFPARQPDSSLKQVLWYVHQANRRGPQYLECGLGRAICSCGLNNVSNLGPQRSAKASPNQ